jgi:hypothetical protein
VNGKLSPISRPRAGSEGPISTARVSMSTGLSLNR